MDMKFFWEVGIEFYYLMFIHFPCNSPIKKTHTSNFLHNIYYLFSALTYVLVFGPPHVAIFRELHA